VPPTNDRTLHKAGDSSTAPITVAIPFIPELVVRRSMLALLFVNASKMPERHRKSFTAIGTEHAQPQFLEQNVIRHRLTEKVQRFT
jgi:hypothetical protein